MSERGYAYLDLAALPAVGQVLLGEAPAILYSADGRRVLCANAAGAAFLGERVMAELLDRRFSPALPSTDRLARFARNSSSGQTRLERISFASGASLRSLAVACTRLSLPDGEPAVLALLPAAAFAPGAGDAAHRLVSMLAAEDCLVAILDDKGAIVAGSGGFETLAAGEAAIDDLVDAVARREGRLVKRVIRVGDARRPAAIAAIGSAARPHFLLVVGPAERIVVERPEGLAKPAASALPESRSIEPGEPAAAIAQPAAISVADASVEVSPSVPTELPTVLPEAVEAPPVVAPAVEEAAVSGLPPVAAEPGSQEPAGSVAVPPPDIEPTPIVPALESSSPPAEPVTAPPAVRAAIAASAIATEQAEAPISEAALPIAQAAEPDAATVHMEAAEPATPKAEAVAGIDGAATAGATPVEVTSPAASAQAATSDAQLPETAGAGASSPASEAARIEEAPSGTQPPALVSPDVASEAPPFSFAAPAGPVRFVYQMNAEGRFTLVSPEFAAIVGPRSAPSVGEVWGAVAAARGLDADGAVAAVIARRDTWSGVTLDWPADGTDERVAVDLAALPAFSRDRVFEGYRGFGVIRPLERRVAAPAAKSAIAVPAVVALPRPAEPSNVVRLPRAAIAADGERLSPPEQDAFRRIAAALGADPSKPSEAKPANPPIAEPAGESPEAAPAIGPEAPQATAPPPERTAPPIRAEAPEAATLAEPAPAMPELTPLPESGTPAAELDTLPPEPDAPPVGPVVAAIPAPAADGLASAEGGVAAAESRVASAESKLKAADGRLAAAEGKLAELEAILDTATDGVVVVDGEGRIERINRSAEALFGIEAAEVAGRPFTDLLAEESRKSALDYLDGLARNGVASVLNDGREVIGHVPQGGLIPLFMTMGRLAGSGRFCAVLRDITQWKNAEEELINARRAAESASMQKSDFLAKVSHEIRTPLNAIIGFSEVMMEERFGPIGTERYKEYLRDIHVSGAHLMSLLNDLLDLSKIEAGKLDLSFEAVSLNEIVMECVALMQPQANRERIIIRTSLSGQVPSIVADPRSIRQIVLNLVSNAIKFTLAGGQVIVSTAMEERGEVTLRIRDTGVGMSEKDIETALKPFRQLSTASKPRSDGTGLGLPLTKALVEANRAAFAIDSTVGQGTLIRITFPTTRVLAG